MRKIGIEELLNWAFVQELPKQGAFEAMGPGFSQAWSLMQDVAALGTTVDTSPKGYGAINQFGVVTDFVYLGFPHADAVKVGEAVKAFDGQVGLDIGQDWNPFSNWQDEHGLIAAEVASVIEAVKARPELSNGRHVVSLVTTCAVLGRGPDWHADEPEAEIVGAQGKPLWFVQEKVRTATNRVVTQEVDGRDARTRRPKPGAYRKYRLDRSLRGSALSRLDWQLWQSALVSLRNDLAGRLEAFDLLPFHPSRAPWLRQVSAGSVRQVIEKA